MPGAAASAAFFGVAVLLALAPGPDNLFVLMQSARSGPRGGLAVVAGLCTGLIVHTLAVALGLAALIAASPSAFTALKLAGAIYLLWLAWQAVRPGGRSPFQIKDLPRDSARKLFLMGFLTNLLNPKIAVMYL